MKYNRLQQDSCFDAGKSPLENQSYSNNPNGIIDSGRSNPVLPQAIQNKLEEVGILVDSVENEADSSSAVRSSQAIDLKRMLVRNVVTVNVALPFRQRRVRGSITVDVKFSPNENDLRRVDVKFQSCRLKILGLPLDLYFPLGPVGPTGMRFETIHLLVILFVTFFRNITNLHLGWLRTGYIDDDVRVTRGHKGSVFILSRKGNKKS